MFKAFSKQAVLAAAVVGTFSSISAQADTIIGVFSNPIDSGFILNDPGLGQTTFSDNSSTAPASTFITNGGSTLQWGTQSPITDHAFSRLTFTGASGLLQIFRRQCK